MYLKYFSLFCLLINLKSYGHVCQAMVRDFKHRLIKQTVTLKDLTSETSFDGKHFKIVNAKDDQPISFQDEKLNLRACTVYHHLTIARNFFLTNFPKEHYLNTFRNLVIRLEMPYSFIDSSHYMNEEFKSYNNSLTIPPSGQNKLSNVEPWNYEIWFAPSKKTKVKSALEKASSLLRSKTAQDNLRLGVFTNVGSSMATELAKGMTLTSFEGKLYIESILLSILVVNVTPLLMEKLSSIFKPTLYLDTAMIPEVIYHEFAHIALSNYLKPTHHSPIIEGMANYFAATIGNTSKILAKTKKFSKGLDKLDAKKMIVFENWMEDQRYAQYGFTFGLLWDISQALGPSYGLQVIYAAHKKLNASSNITYELTSALNLSVKEIIPKSEQTTALLALSRVWQKRGL